VCAYSGFSTSWAVYVRECMCAVGVVATAESSCKGGLIRGCSAELSAAQSRAHERGSASHHRLRFTRAVRVCGRGRGKPCSR
jgi:hypothetical protein